MHFYKCYSLWSIGEVTEPIIQAPRLICSPFVRRRGERDRIHGHRTDGREIGQEIHEGRESAAQEGREAGKAQAGKKD